jgi:hypothetical protein
MRRFLIPSLFAVATLSGCSRDDDFDKKYKATDAHLKAEMKRLDKELDTRLQTEPGEETIPEHKGDAN